MGSYQLQSSSLSVGSPRGVLVVHYYGCVSLVINQMLCTTMILMGKISIEAVKSNNKAQRIKVNMGVNMGVNMEVRHVESLLDM